MRMPIARSFLFVPASDPRKLAKALASGAEAVIVDLEDAVAASRKQEARTLLEQSFRSGAHDAGNIWVRVNGVTTPDWEEDLQCCHRIGIANIVLPKTEGEGDVHLVLAKWNEWSSASAATRPLRLLPLIETALGVERAFEIASSDRAVARLALGAVDLSLDLGIPLSLEQDELLYVRSRIVIASRAARLPGPVDSVRLRIDDEEALVVEAMRAKAMGFSGKMAIHPKQIAGIHRVWEYDPSVLAKDRKIVEAFERAEQDGVAAIAVDGEMVDYPVYRLSLQRLRGQQPDHSG